MRRPESSSGSGRGRPPEDLTAFARIHPQSRAVALYENTVIVPTLDAKLIALDATTGKQVWESTVADYGRVLPQQPAARRQGPPHHRPRRPRGDGHPRMAMLRVAGFVRTGGARQ